jgi:regulator of protease activity HflC (stomatin/prohibitin superfamily)
VHIYRARNKAQQMAPIDAGRNWGIKVLRYKIKSLTPRETILRAMQAQITAEREKQAAIKKAQGEATAIRVIAEATAAGVRAVAEAIGDKGGLEAANLKVAQQYVEAFAGLAKTSNTLIVPASASDVAGFVATAMTVLDKTARRRRPPRRDLVHPDYAQVSEGGWKTTRRRRIMPAV